MSSWYEQAKEKLEKEAEEVKGAKEGVMKAAVQTTLLDFCRQDEEFAQAVVQGGSFADCMAAVAKGVGSSISDLDAYKRAVSFYFPGAEVHMHMTIDLCGSVRKEPEREDGGIIHLNFSDLFN